MRYFTWTEPAGAAPARADRELDEICCLEMT